MTRLNWGMIGGGEGSQIGPAHRISASIDGLYTMAAGALDVDPARGRDFARRLGLGRMLLDRVIAGAAERGMRQMVAIIGDSAHVASVRLHEQAGFRLIGTLQNVGYKFGRWLDTVIMQRPLGEGAASVPATAAQSGSQPTRS